jgi:hypothetical protein
VALKLAAAQFDGSEKIRISCPALEATTILFPLRTCHDYSLRVDSVRYT